MKDLLAFLADSRTVDLSHTYEVGMPQSPNHPPYRMLLERRHGDMVRADGGSAANELIVLGGHVGTHIDALAHVSHNGLLYGGVNAADVTGSRGFTTHDISTFEPYLGRAVLLDVPRLHGTKVLEPGYGITADDLAAAERAAGVEVRPGDAVLIASGWSEHWEDHALFRGDHGAPGPDVSAAQWLVDRSPRIVGGETIAFEQIEPGRGHALLPVHRMLLVEAGINIVETMRFTDLLNTDVAEFALLLAPLKLAGATGAPTRPIALLPRSA